MTHNGHDWSGRFPLITEAALRNRNTSFVIDGEAVPLDVDGRSDFNGLHSRRHDDEVQFAFDILVSDGEDLRGLPLSMRKASLGSTASFYPTSSRARSVQVYSGTPACSGWRDWFISTARATIAAAGATTGLLKNIADRRAPKPLLPDAALLIIGRWSPRADIASVGWECL